ncbi:unnamed protein product [Mycena citricolor]|nr:unnamed protein product [Mycena citricolor]
MAGPLWCCGYSTEAHSSWREYIEKSTGLRQRMSSPSCKLHIRIQKELNRRRKRLLVGPVHCNPPHWPHTGACANATAASESARNVDLIIACSVLREAMNRVQ